MSRCLRRPVKLAVAATLLLLAAALSAIVPSPRASAGARAVLTSPPLGNVTGPQCPDVMVVAARGSGESPQSDWPKPSAYTKDQYLGAGPEGYDVYLRLVRDHPGLTFSMDPVMYPADGVAEPPVDADGNGTGGPARLLALNDTTGATLWSGKLGWATDPWTVGRPVSAGSLILVGDPYGDLAAIDAVTGQQAWFRKELSGAPDTQLDAVSGNVLVTSGDFGSADLVNIDNGSVLRQVSNPASGQNAVNESAIDAGVIYVTSESSVTAYGP
jgi:hypothetical protein